MAARDSRTVIRDGLGRGDRTMLLVVLGVIVAVALVGTVVHFTHRSGFDCQKAYPAAVWAGGRCIPTNNPNAGPYVGP
jgi:hypothetical protein